MKALIAMSGGVDSSVAASLMIENGYECMGATMRLYDNEDIFIPREKTCCSLDDVEDARAVAFNLGIPFQVFNFKREFREKVIDSFINAYESGQTPNPCIECNRYLKFERFFERATELGYDYVVTGHYAIAGYDEKDVETRFGALYNAFQYGTPPHAGAAPGIDRMIMLLADSQNIREVIAFPKNKKARDVLMGAPSVVSDEQLKDVHVSIVE